MSKQHQTMPGEPEEAPVTPRQPEIEKPIEPQPPKAPEEAPDWQPEEVPPHPDKTDEAEERATGKGSMQDSVEAELRNRS